MVMQPFSHVDSPPRLHETPIKVETQVFRACGLVGSILGGGHIQHPLHLAPVLFSGFWQIAKSSITELLIDIFGDG